MNGTFLSKTRAHGLRRGRKRCPEMQRDLLLLASLQEWQGKTCENKANSADIGIFSRTGSRTPADSRRRLLVVARGPGLYEPMQADIPPADVGEPGLDLVVADTGGHLPDKACKRPEVAGEALTLPGNYRISVAPAARPISSILAEMHTRSR